MIKRFIRTVFIWIFPPFMEWGQYPFAKAWKDAE